MRTTARLIALLLAVQTLDASAYAADAPRWAVVLANGDAIPVGNTAHGVGGSYEVTGTAFYQWREWFRPGLEIGDSFHHAIQGTATAPDIDGDRKPESLGYTSNSTGRVFHVTPVVSIGKAWHGWRPYLLLGAGYVHSSYSSGTAVASGTTSRGLSVNGLHYPLPGAAYDFFGINAGGGVDVRVTSRFWVGASVQYRRFFASGTDDRQYVTPALRLTAEF